MSNGCKCGSGKRKYATEQEAKIAAAWMQPRSKQPVSVYKCVGSSKWHLNTRNPGLEGLSQARKIALHLVRKKQVTRAELLEMFWDPERRRKHLRRLLKTMADLGVLSRDEEVVIAKDVEGLKRIITVGLRAYTKEKEAK